MSELDWLPDETTAPGRLALTSLPGGGKGGPRLEADVRALVAESVSRVVCLVPDEELQRSGAGGLIASYRASGLLVHHFPIVDRGTGPIDEMRAALAFVDAGLRSGDRVVVHCLGGLGRSGMLAASYLRTRGLEAEAAIAVVRAARSPQAIENAGQEQFVRDFPGDALG